MRGFLIDTGFEYLAQKIQLDFARWDFCSRCQAITGLIWLSSYHLMS